MTGLYGISSRRCDDALVQRRQGYRRLDLDGATALWREEHDSDFLGHREGAQICILPRWIADIRACAGDPAATFFLVEMRHRESIAEAIRRGLALPIVRSGHPLIGIDNERRLAADLGC